VISHLCINDSTKLIFLLLGTEKHFSFGYSPNLFARITTLIGITTIIIGVRKIKENTIHYQDFWSIEFWAKDI
jgi:hypothetical protein